MIPLKSNFCYAILDATGMADQAGPERAGIFLHDTRHLSHYRWNFPGTSLLHQTSTGDRIIQFHSRMEAHAQVVLVRRTLTLRADGLDDVLEIENSSDGAVDLPFALEADADFIDVFEVRGHTRQAPAEPVQRAVHGDGWSFSYRAQDGIHSRTRIILTGIRPGDAAIRLPARASTTVNVHVAFDTDLPAASVQAPVATRMQPMPGRDRLRQAEADVLDQAVADIECLMLHTPQGRVVAAGIPNFVVPFGRDSLITAWLLLDVDPDLARSVLSYLAARQGTRVDPFRDEEPGKILHEHRECELSRLGEMPFRTYYGSADSTPLFVMLLADYVRKSGDIAFARAVEPQWRAAIAWIGQHADGRGLINFRQRQDGKGLLIQSWKDSEDSMSYGDGRLAGGNLAVAEVQGYVHAAYKGAVALSAVCSGSAEEQSDWQRRADDLAARFDALFWMKSHDNYALALDEGGNQLDVNTSDSGHLLWTGIVPDSKASRVIERLFQPDMWSGYGLRTLGANERRYNPLSYHNGSVWPHDTALFAAGLKRYGNAEGVARVREALVALANSSSDLRLPELVGGYPREGGIPPLPYIESCRPQAWAAAAMIYILNA